ncbi:MAG: 7-carboxy-7-deazaguanine synthase, partial [Ignavibacteriales bacterium CG_4_9_14_3_um_filter_30_11]
KNTDELKFVVGNKEDYNWCKKTIKKYSMIDKHEILFSNVFNELKPEKLVNWILHDNLKVRFQLQAHKYIWDPKTKGV